MVIVLNGKKMDVHDNVTLGAVLRDTHVADDTDGVAIAINDAVVPRRQWSDLHLHDGDTVEVIRAVQGG
ncbi:MAG TPA: sulfur carrier protein ThiS [Candidatus Krumholzibacteria bacterium]|nr:sulfur carrier protein ThiS [Candidatus Krumholzibacteria bacterium]